MIKSVLEPKGSSTNGLKIKISIKDKIEETVIVTFVQAYQKSVPSINLILNKKEKNV